MTFETIPLVSFGAEIRGLDLSRDIPEPTRKALYDAWLEHGLLVFRRMGTSVEAHLRLARCFGPLQRHPVKQILVEGNDDLIFLGTEGDSIPIQYINGEPRRGFIYWHSDMSYVPDINKGSVLRMIHKPKSGGQTMWTDTAGAYDNLARSTKERIDRLFTVQTCRSVPEHHWGHPQMKLRVASENEFPMPKTDQSFPLVLQPMVTIHGESGRKSLLLSPLGYVKVAGLSRDEGDALFEELTAHAIQEKYRYTHDWEINDMVLWDNRRTMHCAVGYPVDDHRLVYRATLAEVQSTGRLWEGETM